MNPSAVRKLLCRLLLALLALPLPGVVFAQAWPNRAIRMVVPFSAGSGGTDLMARLIEQRLSASLGQRIVIDNRPGAGGVPATDMVAKAAPDGYTLLMTNVSLAANPYLYPKLPFDPLKDLAPVTMINSAPLLLVVHPSVPVASVKELLAYAKSHPGKLNYGSGGVGSTPHLASELFKSLSGNDAVHVPYKGGAPALNDLVGGQLSFMIENMAGTMPFVKAGKLRALAITSAQRSPLAPELPTMGEAGVPGYEVIGWNGIVAPRGTPPEIVARLQTEVARILRLPEVRQQMAALGAEPVGNTPEEFGAFIKAEMVRWGTVIKEKGIRAE
ncbi:tripartite tricarboxylate transporter substrate binding protein [Ramlibacter sp.]|uniref:tripartite tricarboxylate transporter substrate binding protein n=1 Tax=Ramlibacter sp. TaxID=1917967 RepID=UPI0026236B83|nr:tripartite tricarboxylate transporter substrate binding protein [Ramlibacter sp.]MDB5954092.1 LacI family transcriptional regulator [Ramlibacter sp.]